jgi:hypothetical protein
MKFISIDGMDYMKRREKEMMKTVIENKKKQTPFQMFFLKNDQNEAIEVIEGNKIDFEEVKKRLERGEAVFITTKKGQKSDVNFIAYKQVKEPWYLIRS